MGVNLGSAYGSIEIGTEGAQGAIAGLSSSLKRLGGALSLGVTAPLAGIGAVALKSAAAFETSLNQMQATTSATADEMDALEAQALDLGATTSFSAGEAAEAMLELAKAGMSVEQTSDAIAGVMDLAAAGGIGLADAATITANALNAFGLEASESTAVANTFAAAANASSADVTDLAQGFQMAGAVFAANGQSVDDLAASLAILSNNGIAGSDAGTSLKTMMMRLAASTDEATQVINELGISVYDVQGEMLPFGEIIEQLETATAGMSDAQRNAALQTIFGADAIRAATILAAEGGAAFANMKDAVTAQGAASSMAQARMAGLGGAMEYFKGSIESLLIGAALPFMDALSGMVRGAADLLSQLGTLTPEQQRFAAILGAVAAAAGPVLWALGAITGALGTLLSPLGLVVAAVAGLGVAWSTNFLGIRDLTAEIWAAVQPALQAMGVAVEGFYRILATGEPGDWYGWWEELSLIVGEEWADRIHAAGETLLGFRQKAIEAFSSLPDAWATVQTSFSTATASLTEVWTTVADFFGPSIERVRAAFGSLGESVSGLGPSFSALGTALGSLWEAAQPILEGLGQVIAAVFGVASVALINTFAATIEALGPIVETVVNQITTVINTIAGVLSGATALVRAVIDGDWSAAWDAAKGIVETMKQGMEDTINNLLDVVTTIFTAIYEAVIDTLDDLGLDVDTKMNQLLGFWKGIWESLGQAVQPVIDAVATVKEAIETFIGWITNISIPNPFAGLGDAIAGIGDKIGGVIPGFAKGTSYAPGGLAEINERGREAVLLPRGAKVLTAPQTRAAAAAAGGPVININMPVTVANSEMDFYTLSYRVADEIRRRSR